MVSITVTGATITKGYKGSKAIEKIKNGIRFRIAVRDEKGGWIYHTCHIEDPYLLEKVKMMGLRAGSDIDFLASMRAVKIKEEERTRDLSVFLIRHIEFSLPREEKKQQPQTEKKQPSPGSDRENKFQFDTGVGMHYVGTRASDNENTCSKAPEVKPLTISSLPGFQGYEVLEGSKEWTDFKT